MSSSGSKIRLLLQYDGTAFAGWQKQRHSPRPTVQGTLEAAISRIFDQPVRTIGASRTDAGVHALGQVAHFVAPKPIENYKLLRSLNGLCPDSMAVQGVWEAPEDFHALASALGKTYRYLIYNAPIRHPLKRDRAAWVRKPLNPNRLNDFTKYVVGRHDFQSFQTQGTEVASTVREVKAAVWRQRSPHMIEFSITGNGFLKQMVRNIVGTALDLHLAEEPPEMMKEILLARNRQAAKGTADPQGLYLLKVYYPRDLDSRCRKL